MCKFVYDFYARKVASLTEIARTKMKLEMDKEVALSKPTGRTGQHPADDHDSDDEMDGGGKKSALKAIVNEIQE
jgi:hypothetical protein